MRRLLGLVRTPARRSALVAAVALLLLARLAPYPPRYIAPTDGHFPMGFSPDGRQVALRSQDFGINVWASQLRSETVLIHDLSAAGAPERPCAVNLFTLRTAGEPFPA